MLELPDARQSLRSLLPETVEELDAAVAATDLHILTAVLEDIWGHVGQAAVEQLERSADRAAGLISSSRQSAEREARIYWDCIAPETREQLKQFFHQKQFEDQNYRRWTATLKTAARAFFDPAHEEGGVRPLSMALGYVPDRAHDYRAMTLGQAASVRQHSRLPDDLSLLVPCRQNPGLTKYQGLFQAGDDYDDLRVWFFQNHRHNVHQQRGQTVRMSIEHLAEDCEEEGATTTCACLQACLQAVEGRYECFGQGGRPHFFSAQTSWEYYRQAVTHASYWFSCEEAALIALLAGRNIDIYKFNRMESCFELQASARGPAAELEVVAIALDPGPEEQPIVRGHFSRMWPATSWEDHAAIVAAAIESRQRELEAQQLRDNEAHSGHGQPPPGDHSHEPEGAPLVRSASCSTFSSEIPCGAQSSFDEMCITIPCSALVDNSRLFS